MEKLSYTLGKQERLKSRKQIELLFKEGKTFSVPPLRVYYSTCPLSIADSTLPRVGDQETHCPLPIANPIAIGSSLLFGVAVGTKHFKKAVDRNRVKRLMREAWRLQKNNLQQRLKQGNQQLHVFFIFTGKELPAYELIAAKTKAAILKLEELYVQSAS